jgi:hypothetical protein
VLDFPRVAWPANLDTGNVSNQKSVVKSLWRGPLACRIETRLDACLEFLSTPQKSVETSLDAARKVRAPRRAYFRT